MRTIITTDSGSNPRDISNMAPCLIVDSNGMMYYDMRKINKDNIQSISNIEVFKKALSGGIFTTLAPNIGDIMAIMRSHVEEGNKVIHISMSSGISAGSVNAARVAADIINEGENNVTVIDSLTGGSGGTIINDYAENLAAMGVPYEEIVEKVLEVRNRILTSFYISKIEGLINSGKVPEEAIILDDLSFRYRVDINQSGRLYPKLPPYYGNVKKEFMKYLKTIINEENKNMYDHDYFALLISKLNEIDIDEVKNYLESLKYFNSKLIDSIPFYGAISAYGVEDQVGIALIKKGK